MENKYGEYTIKSAAGSGGCGQVIVVEKEGIKEAFILKTLKEKEITLSNIRNLQNEIDMLIELNKEPKSKYIPPLHAYDKKNYQKKEEKKVEDNNIIEEETPKEEKEIKARPYYVTDLYSKGSLLYYVTILNYSYSEKHAKVIFKKIIEGIKFCHDRGICHLDIKPENIVFNTDFEPVIIDYGFAAKFVDKDKKTIYFTKGKGTKQYISPEMRVRDKFDGVKCDIFSLGQVLFNLVTGSNGFGTSSPSDKYYKLIKNKNYEGYWTLLLSKEVGEGLSGEFKKLYLQMVAFEPDERPTLEQILESDWLKEIKNLSDKEKADLENEVKGEFINLFKKIKGINDYIKLADELIDNGYTTRSLGNNHIFNNNLRAKKIPNDRININHYIIIEGYLDEADFMNNLIEAINGQFDDEVLVKPSETSLKFEVSFDNEEEDDEQDTESAMIIELFKYEDDRYLVEFMRSKGGIPDYYKNFLKIKEITQNMLKNE